MSAETTGGGGAPLRALARAHLLIPEADDYRLDIGFSAGGGLAEAVMGPARGQPPFSIGGLVTGIANALGLSAELGPVANLTASEPWSYIFQTRVAPYVTVEVVPQPRQPSVRLVVQLYQPDGVTYGVTIPPTPVAESWLKIEPTFVVYDLIVEYVKGSGVDVRARVSIPDQPAAQVAQGTQAADEPTPPTKSELVSYPFPTPPPRSPNLRVHYVGLGQRFGPTANLDATDPIGDMFTQLESLFTTNDPTTLLTTLGSYYDPRRDWFVGLDVEVRGWRVRAVFNDPVLYGLEVTCDSGTFAGLLFEVLYQKLAPGLGVYYGALTLPAAFRRVQLGALTLVLPSFRIWVYTNGDFKVCVGWPIGPDSIGVEVAIFTGGGGFYFAKLRSGDNPASGPASGVRQYAPILEFGLGVWLGLGRSFTSGPFSASLSLTLNGTFQGVIAWYAPPTDPDKATPAGLPDYHWFAATVGLVGQLQGEVDLKVVKLSVLVRLAVTAAVAFETDYGTVVTVSANVDVEASLKILFVRITVGFHATISQTFTLFTGQKGIASVDGPQTPPFRGMNDWVHAGLTAPAAPVAVLAPAPVPVPPPAEPAAVDLSVLLQPTVRYDAGAPTVAAVLGLLVECPPPSAERLAGASPTPLEILLTALEGWLLRTYAAAGGGWPAVLAAIGTGRAAAPATWDADLTAFLQNDVRFTLHPVDLAATRADVHAGAFPVFPALQVQWNGTGPQVPFATTAPTYDDYPTVVEEYFAALSLSTSTANPDLRGASRWGAAAPAAGDGPTGPSLATHVFDDYFLTVARHVAQTLDCGTVAAADLARDVAGLTSRYLLNGLRLPDPAQVPPAPPVDLSTLVLQPGYALAGQQQDVAATGTAYTATLSLATGEEAGAASLAFAGGGTSVTSSMPLAAPPPAPAPVWSGAGATIAVTPLPAAEPQECWSAQRTRLPWDDAGTPRLVVPLPPDIAAATAAGPVTLAAQTSAPGTTPVAPVAVRPALTIPVRLHLVPRTPDAALDGSTVNDPNLTYVYRVDGTDDATRTRIERLLASGSLDGATVSLLYDAETTGYVSDALDPATHPVLLAKTNLSTTTAPTAANLLMATPPTADPGPVTAPFTAAGLPDLLRLVWEVSVVHTGGFYLRYETAAPAGGPGNPLPPSLFDQPGGAAPAPGVPSGTSAPVTLLVTFPDGPVEPWHDSLVTDPLPDGTGTLYLGPATAAGPVTALQPSYPPGCVAFRAAWTSASPLDADQDDLYTPAWIAALYHLLRFRVDGADPGSEPPFGTSLWSVALAETDDPAAGGTSYRQVVPVSRCTGDGTHPYAAVGGRPLLDFRLDDVFGNELTDGYAVAVPVTYSDPIQPPGAWPGVAVRYSFQPAGTEWDGSPLASPSLCLSFEFDPRSAGPAGSDQRQATCFAYAGIAAQLADPRLALAVTTTVLPSNGGTVDDGTLLRPVLIQFVTGVLAQLAVPDPASVRAVPAVPIDPKDLANRTDDVFPVGVTIVLTRPPDLVYADASGRYVPGSDTASTTVAADLDPPPGGTPRALARATGDAPPPADVSITGFGTAFEATFAAYDGGTGAARLLVRTGNADLTATGGPPAFWALRWSATAGIHVSLGDGAPAYFSLAPLSTTPLAGQAEAVTYDRDWNATLTPATYTGVDLDDWARAFLAAMDRVAAPDAATVAAAAAPGTYTLLMEAKAVLARALALGVVPVFDGRTSGDLDAARDDLEQASLSSLGSAYTVSSIVQVPAAVTVSGVVEPGQQTPPRLFGPVTTQAAVTTTTTKLPLAADTAYLTVLVTANDPTAVSDVVLDPVTYAPRFVEHCIDQADADYGYVPSQWLRVALPRADDFLDLPLGRVDAPVPARDVPATPSLSAQTATQSAAGGSLFAWDYAVGLTLPDAGAQDALWLDVTYNVPLGDTALLAAPGDPVQALFGQLASFESAWAQLAPAVDALAAAQDADPSTAVAVFGAVWDRVRAVTEAWAALRGVPVPWPPSLTAPAATAGDMVPGSTDHYAVSLAQVAAGVLAVSAQAPSTDGGLDPGAIVWPLIDGAGPVSDPVAGSTGWFTRTYRVTPAATGSPLPLAFVWPSLDALTRQTAKTSCWVVRNADLSSAMPPPPVNPAFVYRTPVAAFASPVVPLLVIGALPVTPAAATLADTLTAALADVVAAGSLETERHLRIEMTYSWSLGSDLRASAAVLLTNDICLVTTPTEGDVTPEQLVATLSANATTWWTATQPSTVDGQLDLSVVVFADVSGTYLPLVRFLSIPVAVPPGWWPA